MPLEAGERPHTLVFRGAVPNGEASVRPRAPAGVHRMLLASLCKTLIHDGALTLIDADGRTYRFGRSSRATDVVVRLHDRSLHYKLAIAPFSQLGEAFANGSLTIDRGGIYDLVDLCARNLERLEARAEPRIVRALRRLPHLAPRRTIQPTRAHRDDAADVLYDAFLDRDRHYSCAYFADPRMTLEEAQEAKKRHVASKLLLRPGQKVLDIGSGWGGLALHLAESGGADVTALTSSPQQLAVARRRSTEARLAGRVRFHLRALARETGRYDRIVSVSTLEHAGSPRAAELIDRLHDLLTDDGVAVIHLIGRMDGWGAALPWLGAHATVPALSAILPALERARLWVTDLEVLRLHYAETLRHWRRRFVSNWERVAQLYDDRFCRAQEFSFALGEAGFRRGGLMVLELQLAKRVDAVPLTREYMYERATRGFDAGLAA